MNNIVLIGFMGVGKGTTARAISKKYDLVTIDTDDLIESMQKRKIKEIFADEGEEYFRDLEKRVAKWLEVSVKDTVISTGGGFYKVENIKKIGKVVLLDAPFEYIYNRIANHPEAKKKMAKRPLFKSKERAEELYQKRVGEYKKVADLNIDVENKEVDLIAKEIYEKLLKNIHI